jgi:hypothetical protein
MKSQCEQVLNLIGQMEQLHEENTRLVKFVSSVTSDRDEVSRRLEIFLQMNDTLKSKQEHSFQSRLEITELQEALEQERFARAASYRIE